MRSLAKRLGVLFVLLLFPLFVQSMAEAYTYVYDDFNTTPDSKWTSQGATGLFTFGGGTLNFSASASTNEQFLYASYLGNPVQFRNITGASIQFSNYSSTNTYAAGHGASSYVGFEVSENVQNFIYIIRGHNGGTGGGGSADLFEVYGMKNNVFSSGSYVYVSPDPVSGMFGFVVSSSGIQAEYNLGRTQAQVGRTSALPCNWRLINGSASTSEVMPDCLVAQVSVSTMPPSLSLKLLYPRPSYFSAPAWPVLRQSGESSRIRWRLFTKHRGQGEQWPCPFSIRILMITASVFLRAENARNIGFRSRRRHLHSLHSSTRPRSSDLITCIQATRGKPAYYRGRTPLSASSCDQSNITPVDFGEVSPPIASKMTGEDSA